VVGSQKHRLAQLFQLVGLPDCSDHVVIEGSEPILPSRHPLAEAAALALGGVGGACARLWADLTGESARATVELREAAAALDAYRRLDIVRGDQLVPIPPPSRDALSAPIQAADDRWIQLNGTQRRFRDGTLRVLGCTADAGAVQRAVRARTSSELEEELSARGLPAAVYRTPDEWTDHAQGALLSTTPLIEVERVGDSPPAPLAAAGQPSPALPLDGTRIIDLSRVLAGPSAVKLLTAFGAEALRLTRPGTFEEPSVITDTGFGKRSAWMDLDRPAERRVFDSLLQGADVLVENSRYGSLARKGVGVESLTELRPGLIYVSLNCYGHAGPWRERRGYEPHADAVAGLRTWSDPHLEPDPFFRTIADYASGWLAALGIIGALRRRGAEGGSYHVRVSLARTAMWVESFPTISPDRATGVGDVEPFMMLTETPMGLLRHCRPPVSMSGGLPIGWRLPPSPLGSHIPDWEPGYRA
jgi:crotonobetainyl-CoA:carnitine CoA-transferase CaiB-like acyl-CoA transferase